MSGKRTKRMLLTIAAVGAGVGIAACGGGTSAVGSIAIPEGDAGDGGASTGDGGDAGAPAVDASHPVGVVPMPHDGGPVGVVIMVDASDQ